MAKMFYTMEETQAALGKNEEEVKQLTREGRLREYRDGAKLMYKSDQVDQLKNELAAIGGDALELGGAESGAPIGLVDSKGGSGSVLGLADSVGKEDSSLAADLGASGTGIPSPGRSGSRTGTATGITVFGMEEGADRADPSAQTAATPALGSEMGLESVGSGSGLLDLTRESDDTSLGAELLDEIQPGKGKRGTRTASPVVADMPSGAEATIAAESAVVRSTPTPVAMVEAPDPLAPALGAASLGAALVLLFACVALLSACLGYEPAFLDPVVKDRGMLIISGFLIVPVIIFFVAGLLVGKTARR